MNQSLELETKRREVREEIHALKEKIPSAQVLNRFGRLFSKRVTNQNLSFWISNMIFLNLAIFWIWVPIGLALHEVTQKLYLWRAALLATQMQILGLAVNYVLMRTLFDQISDHIVEKINTVENLSRLVEWLHASFSARKVNSFVLMLCLIWMSLGVGAVSLAYQSFVGWGFSLTMLSLGVIAAVAIQGIYWENTFVANLRTCSYELNAFSPADSELVSKFADIFNSQLYGIAAYFGLYTLLGSTNLVDKKIRVVFAVPFLAICWLGIISQFLLTRTTLGQVIRNAKWVMLNRIQTQINFIEATSDLSEKAAAEKLLRLANLHGKVMASKSNTFDLRSISTVISQLMIPLLGLLFGNLDKIITLLR